ncbi:MAG: hypothetical protein DLM58_08600 [Pseudonocardiales bacterium]|nr:MAG: hypothetical protein DLM58_08600 [Pseudonocardiales bacterium]
MRGDRVQRYSEWLAGGRLQANDEVGDPARHLQLLAQVALLAAVDGQVDETAEMATFAVPHLDLPACIRPASGG